MVSFASMAETIPPEMELSLTNGLKKTKFGTLFQKDAWDLFSSLMLTLELTTHKQMGFKAYRDTFLGHEAVQSLGSIKIIRSPDTRDLSNLVPLSTRTAKLSEDSALAVLQHFLDASLISDATKKENLHFKTKGIYIPTPKGLLVLEEFIQTCDLESEADHLIAILSSRPTPRPKLTRLERRRADDELIITQLTMANLFRDFVGPFPNHDWKDHTGVLLFSEKQTYKLLKDVFKKDDRPFGGKASSIRTTHCVRAPVIIHWLCDNTVISSPQEGAEVAAQFIRFGLLVLVDDRAEKGESVSTFKVTGSTSRGNPSLSATAEFRYSHRGVYAITDEGNFLAGWPGKRIPSMVFVADLLATIPGADQDAEPPSEEPVNAEDAERLRTFIKDPSLLVLFRQFLSEKRREHDLSFWIDVEDFKVTFEKVAKAMRSPPPPPVAGSSKTPMEPLPPPDRPHESLGNIPFLIYNTYLAPSSECKISINIGSELREELQRSLEHCIEYLTNKVSATTIDEFAPGDSTTLEIDQLEILIWLYDRIQTRIFSALAKHAVPRFLRWPKYKALRTDALESVAEDSEHSSS